MACETPYGRVARDLWHNDTFSVFSAPPPNAQTLWLYLLNGPSCTSIPGVLVTTVESIATDLKWPVDATRRCLDEITVAGWAQVDHAAGLVWLPKSLKHNMPANPSVVRGWRVLWPLVPACPLRTKIGEHFRRALHREDLARTTASSRLTGQGLEFYVEVMLGEREAPPSSRPRSSRRSSQRPMAPPSSTPSGASWQAPHGGHRVHGPHRLDGVHGVPAERASGGSSKGMAIPTEQAESQVDRGVVGLADRDLYKARASDLDLISGSGIGSGRSDQTPEERSPLPPQIFSTANQPTADATEAAPITARSTAPPVQVPPAPPTLTGNTAPTQPALALVAPTPKAAKGVKRGVKQDTALAMLTAAERATYDAILGDGSLWPIVDCPATCASDLVGAAPGVDVPTAVRAAGAWLRANPAQRKKNGALFLFNWVTRRQERGTGGVGAAGPGSPPSAAVAPEVERTMRYFGANLAKVTGNVYGAPTAHLRHAAELWAEAQKGEREAKEQVIGDAYKPDAEACVRYWVGRYFREANQKVKDANYPFAWLVSSIGGYGLPKRDPRPQGGTLTPRTVPIAPQENTPAELPAAAMTAEFTANMLAIVTSKPGSSTTDQPTLARRK